jgi:hypothetical protein
MKHTFEKLKWRTKEHFGACSACITKMVDRSASAHAPLSPKVLAKKNETLFFYFIFYFFNVFISTC